jgi:UDP-N-acetylmuramate dehydrogenase
MRIGGTAKYFAELKAKEDVEEAYKFAKDKKLPLLVLGSGSNTIFANEEIQALIVQVKNEAESWDGNIATLGAGKNLAMFINECAEKGLDLSPLTGIPGTIGGAVFGNAGQGPSGTWIDGYVEGVTAFIDGKWQTLSNAKCDFEYRESAFKKMSSPILWEVTLQIPKGDPAVIKTNIHTLLKTAGSCFKAVAGTPAWQLIDDANLRGATVGDVEIAHKHANFLLNKGEATYKDACALVEKAMKAIPKELEVEMRFVEQDGSLRF